jgi:hypothetical protein
MASPVDGVSFSGLAGNPPQFGLKGGYYVLVAVGTLTSVQLTMLGPDGTTFVNIGTALSAAGLSQLGYLPPGQYRLAVTATSAAVSVSGCPTS